MCLSIKKVFFTSGVIKIIKKRSFSWLQCEYSLHKVKSPKMKMVHQLVLLKMIPMLPMNKRKKGNVCDVYIKLQW